MTRLGGERVELSSVLEVKLFGKFCARWSGRVIQGLQSKKVQELLAFLLVNRGRPHLRENLADRFWEERGSDPRKNLRQTLWQIQSALTAAGKALKGCIEPEGSDWIQLDRATPIQTDVEVFQQAVAEVEQVAGTEVAPGQATLVERVLGLYRGDFLEGCYGDWCLFERERLRDGYLLLLDKMMSYCEVQGDYRAGIEFGVLVLKQDNARERTHRRLMRLHCLAGDRTAALRQYQRCVAALQKELDVGPARRTLELFEAIRADRIEPVSGARDRLIPAASGSVGTGSVLEGLIKLRDILSDARREVHQEIQVIERARRGQGQLPEP